MYFNIFSFPKPSKADSDQMTKLLGSSQINAAGSKMLDKEHNDIFSSISPLTRVTNWRVRSLVNHVHSPLK